ncbi:hypothetical protein LX32DRAFT_415005 [Colletotrichum zoysiae]|uniref:Uncharacterized protein n=1 Tax=Colletotrichum zoysiae TaxID=1216348 RepID=A0AAD9HH67_9PEZI|nr:hypothetical protein LX32DRAFT_415005 [Colletotrichum zoysiae]
MHTCIHTSIHAYIQTDRQTYIHTYMHTCIHVNSPMYVHLYISVPRYRVPTLPCTCTASTCTMYVSNKHSASLCRVGPPPSQRAKPRKVGGKAIPR